MRRTINFGMAISAISGLLWVAALYLILPVSRLLINQADLSEFTVYFVMALIFVSGSIVLRVLSFLVSHRGAFDLEVVLRTELTDHLAKVPLGYVNSTGSGAIKKVLMDDVRSLHSFVADSTPLMARAFIAPIASILFMILIDWRMALLSFSIIPIAFVTMTLAFKDYAEERRKYDAANEHINNTIIEYVQGMQVVRTFDDGSETFKRYEQALDNATRTMEEWMNRTALSANISRTLFHALVSMIILLPVGLWMYNQEFIDFPVLLLSLMLGPILAESVIPIVWMNGLLNMAKASSKRIGVSLNIPVLPEPVDPKTPENSGIIFENVTFTYSGREEPAINNVNITIEEGKVTALVGPSGAGKSTLAKLIPRFWDVDTGSILIGGVDVKDITFDELMKHVGFVFQDPFLLNQSIRQNIKLGKPEATDEEVYAAAKAAQAHEFILAELPSGYDSIVGDRGTSLSGGQRQRITIARTILENCPILVLDEATAFADPENEAEIHTALSNLMAGKTIIVIAHRLSTIVDADQIIVLDNGKVVESGKHGELVAQKGVYHMLWSRFEEAQNWGLRAHDTDTLTSKASIGGGTQ